MIRPIGKRVKYMLFRARVTQPRPQPRAPLYVYVILRGPVMNSIPSRLNPRQP